MRRERGPLVVKLPRAPGRKDAEYMHQFSGDVDVEAYTERAAVAKPASVSRSSTTELEQRVAVLEAEVAAIRAQLAAES